MAQIKILEEEVKARVKPRSELKWLKTVAGVGEILGWTILLESGDIRRFSQVGRYASYCRCVESKRTSNGKKKARTIARTATSIWPGRLWRRPTLRSVTMTESSVIINASALAPMALSRSRRVLTSLARASYYVQRDQVAFDMTKALG
jgi:hypothetical protein